MAAVSRIDIEERNAASDRGIGELGKEKGMIRGGQCKAVIRMLVRAGTFAFVLMPFAVAAQTKGTSTNLPVPRFVSLKADKVNLRSGPTRDNAVNWVFTRAGLPVEITAESENWRKIRDSEGTEGWVFHTLLSSRRTVLVAPWAKKEVRDYPLYDSRGGSTVTAKLQPGVLASVKSCDGKWCRIFGDGFSGYIEQERLWGVYPNEAVE
jgi:SH3-like domain-containing protein